MDATITIFCIFMAAVAGGMMYNMHSAQKIRKKLEREGRVVPCYIMMANKILYDESDARDSYAQVVFTMDNNARTDFGEIQGQMQKICEGLFGFQADPAGGKEEKQLEELMRTQKENVSPLKIPKRITGEMNAYTSSVLITRAKLPQRKIEHPWVYCRVAVGENGSVEMIDAPR